MGLPSQEFTSFLNKLKFSVDFMFCGKESLNDIVYLSNLVLSF